jgi:hypothetical protein
MEEAERIAREEHGSGRIAVISGKLDSHMMHRRADPQVLVPGITTGDWDIGWMDRTWSRICCMMTTSSQSGRSLSSFWHDCVLQLWFK